jgi:DNA helicase TIP49 (TBP-interacting protein)
MFNYKKMPLITWVYLESVLLYGNFVELVLYFITYSFLSSYVIQLLMPAKILAETHGRVSINKQDLMDADCLFFDAKSSAKRLKDEKQFFLL